MSQDTLNFIYEINIQNDSWMIKVRIVRLWKQPFSLDMILMDERGEKIQGTIKTKLIHTFERLLTEGSIVVLSKFGVDENSGSYRIINHPYVIGGVVLVVIWMYMIAMEKKTK
ncbi:hypothetical protein OSB04_018977 [Centaurea solstitialis]|uniref:Replication protein A 70 kDa DNA-binding subunit B/D first OB fold domain-containing protein n=1 Tax=Centaurea solstitialis TaxID=347529 RepID=A0AA38SPE3_9ASTR|nr:hypothetical protein OSB04_018977 [Centaurea solstitialis]